MRKRSRFGRKACPVCRQMVTKCAHARARHIGSKKCLEQAGGKNMGYENNQNVEVRELESTQWQPAHILWAASDNGSTYWVEINATGARGVFHKGRIRTADE